ncbi:F-box protein At1g80960-like [Neltuma alba]|uniref:F-box protein At1g80960-like n=1 Tax=Neltuma alba TaxID=207710 RepID=UPI0010A59F3C|nr:F-box protein At1g80960-like [Prosopis alba]
MECILCYFSLRNLTNFPLSLTCISPIPSSISFLSNPNFTVKRKEKKRREKKMLGSKKKAKFKDSDFISNLPDDILLTILSLLPVDEAVRSSILSKRWVSLWKNTPHLDFNVKHMIKPLTQLRISSPAAQLHYVLNLPKYEGIRRYNIIVFLLLHKHLGGLKSCKFTHFPQKDIQINLAVLFERQTTIDELSLECKPLKGEKIQRFLGLGSYGIFSSLSSLEVENYYLESSIPFGGCLNLRTLKLKMVFVGDETLDAILRRCYNLESLSLVGCSKLKNMKIVHVKLKFLELRALCVYQIIVSASSLDVLDLSSLACPKSSSLVIIAPRLRVFQSHNKPISHEGLVIRRGNFARKTHEFLETLAIIPPGTPTSYVFGASLLSLMVDLDLKIKRANKTLSFILRCCVNLETLKIITPVYRSSKLDFNGDLHYPMLWERSDVCHCVHQTLKFVSIMGFAGNQLEADFVKHLITRASNMEKITIVCKSSKKDVSFLVPLEDQRASANLSIMVKVARNKSALIELNELYKNKSRNCFFIKN